MFNVGLYSISAISPSSIDNPYLGKQGQYEGTTVQQITQKKQ